MLHVQGDHDDMTTATRSVRKREEAPRELISKQQRPKVSSLDRSFRNFTTTSAFHLNTFAISFPAASILH